jgi:hypothetical protein
MSRNLLVALALAVLSLAAAAPAHAVLITVNFTVTSAPNDPSFPGAGGTTSSGSFTFDSSVIPSSPGTVLAPPDLATGISFTWGGNTWTENGAGLYSLTFASQGTWEVQPGLFLTDWALAGDIFGTGLANITPDFLVNPGAADPFVYIFFGVPRVGTLNSW